MAFHKVTHYDYEWLLKPAPGDRYPDSFRFFVPSVYDRYLRLPHPAQLPLGVSYRDVSWSEMAAAINVDVSPGLRLAELARARELPGYRGLSLPPGSAISSLSSKKLASRLATVSPDGGQCIFGFDTSWGDAYLPDASLTTVSLPWGSVAFLGGVLGDITEMQFLPSLWWATDRAWVIVTPLEATSSLIGCTYAAAQRLTDGGIEAFDIGPDVRVVG